MPGNPDFSDLFSALNAEAVEYLVAGAHAVIYHTAPRYTKDLDVWVNPVPENAARVWRALARFGAPLQDVTEASFTDRELVYQIGIAPNRIDILMGIAGVEFCDAWADRVPTRYDGIPIYVMGRRSLLAAKKAAGRPQDLLDAAQLESGT
jgi:hypothetical protein